MGAWKEAVVVAAAVVGWNYENVNVNVNVPIPALSVLEPEVLLP